MQDPRSTAPIVLLLIFPRTFLSQVQLPHARQTWINPIPTSICCHIPPKPFCGLPGPDWIPTGLLQHVLGGEICSLCFSQPAAHSVSLAFSLQIQQKKEII